MNKSATTKGAPPAQLIDERIAALGDWRSETLGRLRDVILRADAGIVEEWKWNVPVWSHAGILCTGETYKSAVKLTFAKGASLKDPSRLFNSSLEGNTRRAIDFKEGGAIDAKALQALIREAVTLNAADAAFPAAKKSPAARTRPAAKKSPAAKKRPATKEAATKKGAVAKKRAPAKPKA
jgi:hypothetical protein